MNLFFAKVSTNKSTTIEYETNKAKTVTAYVHQTDKRAGVKIKAGDLGSSLSIGKEGVSISGNLKNNNVVYSSNYSERIYAFDYTFSVSQGKNSTSYSITIYKLNIALAILTPGYALGGIGGKAIEVFA